MPQKSTAAPRARQIREANSNWRGGRSVASNGYVLIRVGVEHPMADVRGYAYEHRLVMAKKLGRSLESHEIVHHKNENKTDNRPENLELVTSNAEHFVLHRTRDDLRLPGEPNPEVACACGCGVTFPKYDTSNRPRLYVSGHNPHAAPTINDVISILARLGPLRCGEIIELTGRPSQAVRTVLCKLAKTGRVVRLARGLYTVQETTNGYNVD